MNNIEEYDYISDFALDSARNKSSRHTDSEEYLEILPGSLSTYECLEIDDGCIYDEQQPVKLVGHSSPCNINQTIGTCKENDDDKLTISKL